MALSRILKQGLDVLTRNISIVKTRPEIKIQHSGTQFGRMMSRDADLCEFTQNLSYDGTNWNLDNTSVGGIYFHLNRDGQVIIRTASAGSNPRTLTDTFRITAGGNIGTFGGNITFPTTQVSSADANTLDDYEEGNWTPQLAFNGAVTGITYDTQVGSYVKIGRFVHLAGRITLTNKGSATGMATIGGFPFTVAASSRYQGAVSFGYWAFLASSVELTAQITDGATSAIICNAGAAISTPSLTDTAFGNTSEMYFSLTYMASA